MVYTQLFNFRFLLFSLIFISSTTLIAQDILWEKSYGGLHADYLLDAQPTADYGFILAGSSLSGKTGNKAEDNVKNLDYWVWKMDEKGDLDWQKSFGGDGTDMLQSIQNTADGGFILGGTSTSSKGVHKKEVGRGQEDLWIIKLNAGGEEQWQKTIGGTGRDVLKSILPTRDGGYIIGASSSSIPSSATDTATEKKSKNHGNMDYWVIKLDNSGTIEWEKTYGGIYADILESIAQTEDDGFIVGGYSNSPLSETKGQDNLGEGDFWVLKLDKSGTIEWQRTLGGDGDDHLYSLQQSQYGGYILGGNTNSGISGSKSVSNGKGTDFWVLKLDSEGNIDWQETYDFGKTDILTTLIENEDGTILLGGYAQTETLGMKKSNSKGINDYIAIKIAADGEKLWHQTVGSNGEDVLKKLIETRDGGYLLAGTSKGTVSRDKNSNHGKGDFWVVKLRDKDKEIEERSLGLEAFPNPANDYTNVIVNHDFEKGTVYMYDIAGRELQQFKVENRTIPINMNGMPIGVYLVTVATDVKTQTIKILKGN